MKKKVLVTGSYGFIGRYIAREYKNNGCTVTGIGHGKWENNKFLNWGLSDWYDCDITVENLVRNVEIPQYIIHCAGGSSVGQSLKNPIMDFQRTVLTTYSVLEYIRSYAPETKLIYISSAAVYGNVENLPIKEIEPLNPISPYGEHKKISEDLCRYYCNQYNISGGIVRLFSVYGNGLRKQLIWDACNKIAKGDNNFWGTGDEKRDWIHVQDVAKLVYLMSEYSNDDFFVVNGANGIAVSVQEILEKVFNCFQSTLKPEFGNNIDLGNPKEYVADMKKAFGYGWRPQIDLLNGVKAYVEWYKHNEKN